MPESYSMYWGRRGCSVPKSKKHLLHVCMHSNITKLQKIEKKKLLAYCSLKCGSLEEKKLEETEQFTRISPWRCLSIELKESTISNSDIFDMRSCMSAFILACLQSLCCSCSTPVRRLWNHGMKLGPFRNLLNSNVNHLYLSSKHWELDPRTIQ